MARGHDSNGKAQKARLRVVVWILFGITGIINALMGNVVANLIKWFEDKPRLAIGIFLTTSLLGLCFEWLLRRSNGETSYQASPIFHIREGLSLLWGKLASSKRALVVMGVTITTLVAVSTLLWVWSKQLDLTCPPKKLCVLVASLTPVDSEQANELTDDIVRGLNEALDNEHVNVLVTPLPPLEGQDIIQEREQARKIVQHTGILLIAWGRVYEHLGKVRLHFELTDALGVQSIQGVRPLRNAPLFFIPSSSITSTNFVEFSTQAARETSILTYLTAGLIHYAQGQPELAVPQFASALYCAGEPVEDILQDILFRLPECTRTQLARNADLALFYYYTGNSFLLTGDYQRAIHFLKQAASLNPGDPAARAAIGIAYQDWLLQPEAPEAQKALKEAERVAQQLVSNPGPNDLGSVYYELGLIRELRGDFTGAQQSYQDAVNRFGRNNVSAYVVLIGLARAQQQAGDTGAAQQTLELALSLEPDSPWAYLELANLQQEDREAAEGNLHRAASKAPGEVYVDITRAALCEYWQDFNCAKEAYTKAVTKRPESGWLHSRIGDFYRPADPRLPHHSWEKAEAHYRQAIKQRKNDPWSHERLAYALFYIGRYDEAIEHYQLSLDRAYRDRAPARLYCNLGQAKEKAGDRVEARKNYQRCGELATLDEQRTFAEESLKRLDTTE